MQLSMQELINTVDCFLVDLDGTIYKGDRLLPGSQKLIETFYSLSKGYLFLTNNSSVNSDLAAARLSRIGLPTSTEKVLTSGEATAHYLDRIHPGARVFVIGTPALEEAFAARGFTLTENNPEFLILGFDTSLTYAKLWKMCELVYSGIPYIATNPDRTCFYESGFMPEIAPMIAYIESAAGRKPSTVIGKPNRMMAELAADVTGYPLTSMAIIGDSIETDIAMGKNAGIPTILILSGDTKLDDVHQGTVQPDYIFNNLDELVCAMLDSSN
jgi:HAD superfamily hydrolase (TIGR01450 family)